MFQRTEITASVPLKGLARIKTCFCLLELIGNVSDWVFVSSVAGRKLATVLVAGKLRALNNLVPNDHFVALMGIGGVFQDKVQVELFGIPMEKGTEIGLQIKANISQSSWLVHVRVFDSAVPRE